MEIDQYVKELGGMGFRVVDGAVDNFDDRVSCAECQNRVVVKDRMTMKAEELEKFRMINHPANRWWFNQMTVSNGWGSVRFERHDCTEDCGPFPADVRHRCIHFVGVGETIDSNVNGGDEWWTDNESNTKSNVSWWQE